MRIPLGASPDTCPDASLEEDELVPARPGGEAGKGYKPEVEGPSPGERQDKKPAELGTGEAQLLLGSLEASGREGTQLSLISGDGTPSSQPIGLREGRRN